MDGASERDSSRTPRRSGRLLGDLPVCVTGATGYLAAHIVRDLLAKGHRVRGTVRSLNNEKKLAPLRAFPNADEALELVEADMMKPSGFEAMLKGCSALLHTATPIEIPLDGSPPAKTMEEAQQKQLAPAVEGTESLLRAAANVGIKKVVLTSSVASMRFRKDQPAVHNEDSWSDESFLKEIMFKNGVACYALAKTLQERLAWRLAEECGFKLIVINPALIIGPSLTPHLNFSLEVLVNLIKGKGSGFDKCKPGKIPDAYKAWVDVRECSQAHVLALENPEAEGRYLLQSHSEHYAEVVSIMRKHPSLADLLDLPIDTEDGFQHSSRANFDNSKAKRLGVTIIPFEQSLTESVDSLAEQGFINID